MGISQEKSIPSFATGFARCEAESERPDLWKGLCYAPAMFLGPGVGYDVVLRAYGTLRSSSTFTGQTAMGPALYSSSTASTDGAYWTYPKQTGSQPSGEAAPRRPTRDYTILIWYKAIAWNSADSFLWTIPYYTNGWYSPYYVMWLFRAGSGTTLTTAYYNGSTTPSVTSGNGIVDTSDTTNINMYGTTRKGATASFYKNGRWHSSGTFSADSAIVYPWFENQYAIDCRGGFSVSGTWYNPAGYFPLCLVWDRGLSTQEIADVYSDPYSLFRLRRWITVKSLYLNLSTSNTLSVTQTAVDTVAAPVITFSKSLAVESNTIQSFSATDIINHGNFPAWETNSLAWTQTRQAINIRAEANTASFNPTTTTFDGLSADASKWFGGVLSANGSIYSIPYSSATVLKIDPTTDIATTFGSVGADASKWYGGVLAANEKIYGIPHNATTILKIDPATDTATTFGSAGAGSADWAGGVVAANGAIYSIPYNATTILKIDPTTDTVTTFGSAGAGSADWAGGVLASNGYIYGIPYNSTSVLRIDPTTDAVTTFGTLTGSTKWIGGVAASNGMIYGIPSKGSKFLKIDPTTDTATTFSSTSAGVILRKKKITISETYVDADLTDFPLCVQINADTDIGAVCLASGDDIYFLDSNDNQLYSEKDAFAVTAGAATGTFWVKVPTVAAAANTIIYCCYGNGRVDTASTAASVWSSYFKSVHHLNSDSNVVNTADSYSYNNNGTNTGVVGATTGRFNGSGSGYFNAASYIILGTDASINLHSDFTISFWMKRNGWTAGNGWDGIVSKPYYAASWSMPYHQWTVKRYSNGNYLSFAMNNGGSVLELPTVTAISDATWYYITATCSSAGAAKIYINGVVDKTGTTAVPINCSGTTPVYFGAGNAMSPDGKYIGYLDEVRLAGIARSAEWIKFEYYNQVSTTGQLTWSDQYTDEAKWIGGVLGSDGMIYTVPFSAPIVLKIDPTTDTTTTFGSPGAAAKKWAGGVLTPSGIIYCTPHDAANFLKIGGITADVPDDFCLSRHFNKL